ncbi:MAG: UDP-glucose/GDP-mannose dehydrogenase family protein [Bacillota bacterium]
MKIVVIGTGYVGLVTGVCLAEVGNNVICIDRDVSRICKLNEGILPIYEPGLEKLVKDNVANGTLAFATDLGENFEEVDFYFIAVGTPSAADGSTNMEFVEGVAQEIGLLINSQTIIVNKSTVPVGSAELVKNIVSKKIAERQKRFAPFVISNPEFLKEGSAISDFMNPDRIIVGLDDYDGEIESKVRRLYKPFNINHEKLIFMSTRSAEMTKYAANSMLATKISFINEMANICEHNGANVNEVRVGIGSDSRIGYDFIYPGIGFGGSCFPKDIRSLIHQAEKVGCDPSILKAVHKVNDSQKLVLVDKVLRRFGTDLTGKKFAVWGLAFKPNTDDIREAPSIQIIKALISHGASVIAYDPQAIEQAKIECPSNPKNLEYVVSKYNALDAADALLLLTEWREFRSPDFCEMAKRMHTLVIYDGRNQYCDYFSQNNEYGFEYFCIGNERQY